MVPMWSVLFDIFGSCPEVRLSSKGHTRACFLSCSVVVLVLCFSMVMCVRAILDTRIAPLGSGLVIFIGELSDWVAVRSLRPHVYPYEPRSMYQSIQGSDYLQQPTDSASLVCFFAFCFVFQPRHNVIDPQLCATRQQNYCNSQVNDNGFHASAMERSFIISLAKLARSRASINLVQVKK